MFLNRKIESEMHKKVDLTNVKTKVRCYEANLK